MLTDDDWKAEYYAQNVRQGREGYFRLRGPDKEWLAVRIWWHEERDDDGNLVSDQVLCGAIYRNGLYQVVDPYTILHHCDEIDKEHFERLRDG